MSELAPYLEQGLLRLGLDVSADQQQQLLDYTSLMIKWNKVFNLTAITNPREIISRHLFDSLSIHAHVSGQRILDVGSGAGLPGIPLAIMNPNKDFVLLDSNGKKTRFMTQASIELGLARVQVKQTRVEQFQDKMGFDTIIARAFAPIAEAVGLMQHLMHQGSRILLMKGPNAINELSQLSTEYDTKVIDLQVPDLDIKTSLVEITRN